jgi:hypothetical protein
MRIEFTVFAEPYSLNKAYYLKSFNNKSATKIRTKECREWGDRVMAQLQPLMETTKLFKSAFDEKVHALKIELAFYIPSSKFYTKAGHISIAASDITNIEKLLVDLLFDERFNGRYIDGSEFSNFNINDKFIVEMRSRKIPSKRDYKIKIIVEIIEKPEISDE